MLYAVLGDLKLPVGDHVYKLLIKLGFSVQKPGKKPVERDKPAIHTWSRTKGVEISKKSRGGPDACLSGRKRLQRLKVALIILAYNLKFRDLASP
ncbi:winged helix-turn-helix domain-containing protein [Deinococcus peraridilitoris]|uniref:winged helix-turn-helix domain-containing protein n=1 Tax=Deinococcus peraridilitoris TaxID=432329 RepID=UPI00059D33DC|nr:winged helix-turn-helix domain-containing protein [Deinococcus peraridilitoris]